MENKIYRLKASHDAFRPCSKDSADGLNLDQRTGRIKPWISLLVVYESHMLYLHAE
jgi:hypothetical protein